MLAPRRASFLTVLHLLLSFLGIVSVSLSVNKACTCWRTASFHAFDVPFVLPGVHRPCACVHLCPLTSKSFLSFFDFGVNHSYSALVMTKPTMLQTDVASSLLTRFLSCLLRYHRTTRALLFFALR